MIGDVLNGSRPARCERSGSLIWPTLGHGSQRCCPPEGCDVLLQNGHRYGWSESNVRYERLGPVGTRTRVVGPPR